MHKSIYHVDDILRDFWSYVMNLTPQPRQYSCFYGEHIKLRGQGKLSSPNNGLLENRRLDCWKTADFKMI